MLQALCIFIPAKQFKISNIIFLNQMEKVTMAG